jgi:hypothetical protein
VHGAKVLGASVVRVDSTLGQADISCVTEAAPRDYVAYLIAAGAGVGGWLAISIGTGRREAWDTGSYFAVFLPAIVVLSALLGFFFPRRVWRWPATAFGSQAVVLFLSNPTGELLPLGLMVFGFLSIPSFLASWCGRLLATRLR